VQRLRAAQGGGERLQGNADDVVERLLCSERDAARLRVEAQAAAVVVRTEPFAQQARPQAARGPELGDLLKEVGVRVDSENPLTGEFTHTATAYTTFVALDDHGRPTQVPPIHPKTPNEKRRYIAAQKRRESRILLAEEIKKAEKQDHENQNS
jgi:hypothetical protein